MPNTEIRPVTLSPEQLTTAQYPDIQGIYICYNSTKHRYHIGMSDHVYQQAQRVFVGQTQKAVYQDYKNGDIFSITIRPLEGSGLYSLAMLAKHYIDRYGANEDDYA